MPEQITVLTASDRHNDFLAAHDIHLGRARVLHHLSLRAYLVAETHAVPCGFLRFSHFWGTIPFIDMIMVPPSFRHRGIGKALFARFETMMRAEGAAAIMTSCVEGEEGPRVWHSRNGFSEMGKLSFGSLQPEPELFFLKELTNAPNH